MYRRTEEKANRSETEETEMAMTVKSIFFSDGTHLRL